MYEYVHLLNNVNLRKNLFHIVLLFIALKNNETSSKNNSLFTKYH